MGEQGLSSTVSELVEVLRAVNADIDYIAGDTEVTVQRKLRPGHRDFSMLFAGGGGTSFVPIFDAVAKLKTKPAVFIFLTDGDGYCPAEPPPGVHVIWVLCGSYKRDPGVAWGDKIYID
jgi:predicted metal-dependent peptidase